MIRFENTETGGWEAAIRGMRNPKNSWDKSDSYWTRIVDPQTLESAKFEFFVGDNDLKLMKSLAKAGNDHGKFLRMINVSVDITAPLYWVSEHDTYKVGTVRNSCSFMHKGTAKPFEIRDFSVSDERIYDVLSPLPSIEYDLKYPYETEEYKLYETVNHIDGDKGNNSSENLEWVSREENIKKGFDDGMYKNLGSLHCKYIKWKNGSKNGVPSNVYGNENYELFVLCNTWEKTIDLLNSLRQEYLDTKDEFVFQMIRQMLPCGYNVRYTWQANYAVLRNIYHARKNHRLPEWREFCSWIEKLPYANELIFD